MSDEIEVKLIYKDKNAVKKILRSLGATPEPRMELQDRYYSLDGTSMKNNNKLVRIRRTDDDCTLTYKGVCEDSNGVWTREEITIDISDDAGMARILAELGTTMIKENASTREPWMLGDVEIVFIDFTKPARLSLIEVEADDAFSVERVVQELGSTVERAGEEVFASFDNEP